MNEVALDMLIILNYVMVDRHELEHVTDAYITLHVNRSNLIYIDIQSLYYNTWDEISHKGVGDCVAHLISGLRISYTLITFRKRKWDLSILFTKITLVCGLHFLSRLENILQVDLTLFYIR